MISPSSPWEWILTVLLFIISLAVLITIHELGHLSMAKAFNVYCQEFSIGFGPALFHKKPKGKETYFSIRAIPFGGYVSMYGEDMELEDGVTLPPSRSLEGIKRWKKAIILVAGITMNATLALTLFAISNLAFPIQQASSQIHIAENSTASTLGIKDYDKVSFYLPSGCTSNAVYVGFNKNDNSFVRNFYIVDDDVIVDDVHYYLTYIPQGAKNETNMSSTFALYPSKDSAFEAYSSDLTGDITLLNYAGEVPSSFMPNTVKIVEFDLNIKSYLGEDGGEKKWDDKVTNYKVPLENTLVEGSVDSYKWKDIGISLRIVKLWLPFETRVKETFVDFGNASIAVFKGLASLFTQGLKNMSGIVGIMTTSANVYSTYTFSTYLYFWGLISVNLAIFNLLPFPGLDGWQLLVTAIEGGTNAVLRRRYKRKLTSGEISSETSYEDWKIPSKIKNYVSFIGIALLFLFMAAIIVLDILRLVGVML